MYTTKPSGVARALGVLRERRDFLSRTALSILVAVLTFYPQLRNGSVDAGILYTGDVLGFYLPAMMKAHSLIHQGVWAGAIDYSTFNGASEFFLTPNFFSYHPLMILFGVFIPRQFVTFHFTGFCLIAMLCIHYALATYFTLGLLRKYCRLPFCYALFGTGFYVVSTTHAYACGQVPFIFSTMLLPWICYQSLKYLERPFIYNLLLVTVPVVSTLLGGYPPLAIGTICFSVILILLIHLTRTTQSGTAPTLSAVLRRLAAPLGLSLGLISPFIYSLREYHQTTISAGSAGSLFYAAHQLANAPSSWLAAISPAITPPTTIHEFSAVWGLIPVAVIICFLLTAPRSSGMPQMEMSRITLCLGVYLLTFLGTLGDSSVVSDMLFYFFPGVGQMHLYQRLLLPASMFLAIALASMFRVVLKNIDALQKRRLLTAGVFSLLCSTSLLLFPKTLPIVVSAEALVFETLLLVIFLASFRFVPRLSIVWLATALCSMTALNTHYTFASGGNTFANQKQRNPVALDGKIISSIWDFLSKKSPNKVLKKYVDLTPLWSDVGTEAFPKDFPYYHVYRPFLSTYSGFTFYLSARGDYLRSMQIGGPDVRMAPSWDYLRKTSVDTVIYRQKDLDQYPLLASVRARAKAGDILDLPNGISLQHFHNTSPDIALFNNGYFRIDTSRPLKNIAKGKPTKQSSTMGTATASLAVDGNPDGNFSAGTTTHTLKEANAWWEVDLGSEQKVAAVRLWNRTDGADHRLTKYFVVVSKTPFDSTGTGAKEVGASGDSIFPGENGTPSITVNTGNVSGRYVRVQFDNHHPDSDSYLSLAEVEVLQGEDSSTSSTIAAVEGFSTDFAQEASLSWTSSSEVIVRYLFWANPRITFKLNGQVVVPSIDDGVPSIRAPAGKSVLTLHYRHFPLTIFIAMMSVYLVGLFAMLLILPFSSKFHGFQS